MYYLLVRIWTVMAFGLTVLFGYVLFSTLDQIADMSLFLGCGMGLVVWLVGVVLLATFLHPKRAPNLFET